MAARRDAMREVELEEEVEVAPGSPHARGSPVGAAARLLVDALRATGRGVARRRRWWPVIPAALVVVALVVGGTRLVHDRDEAARERLEREGETARQLHEDEYVASLAGVPSVIPPVDESVHELWRAEPDGLGEYVGWEQVGDTLVGTSDVDDGLRIEVLDAATGASLWSVVAAAEADVVWSSCFGAGADPEALLVCQQGPAWGGGAEPSAGSQSHVAAFGLRTGDPRGSFVLPADATALPFDGGVVTLEPAADGSTTVLRREPTTGEVVWTYELSAPYARAADGSPIETIEGFTPYAYGVEAGDGLVVAIQGGSVVLLAADGTVERELPSRASTSTDLLGGGGITVIDDRVLVTQTADGSPVTTDLVTGAEYAGLSAGWQAAVDDGSLGPVDVADDDGTLTLTDVASRATWSVHGVAGMYAWYVLDGRVLVQGERESAAFDGATGAELWRASSARWFGPQGSSSLTVAPTDGRFLLTVEPGGTVGTRALVARAVHDGSKAWAVRVAADVSGVKELGGQLVGLLEDGGIVALG